MFKIARLLDEERYCSKQQEFVACVPLKSLHVKIDHECCQTAFSFVLQTWRHGCTNFNGVSGV